MKKLKVLAGDLVRIPIDENGNFVVCRVISEENVNAHLVEVFSNVFSLQIKDVNNLELGDRLFRPVFLKFMFFDNQKWVLLKHDPDYCRTESDYENIKIAFDGAAPYELWLGAQKLPLMMTCTSLSQCAPLGQKSSPCLSNACWIGTKPVC